MQNKLFTSLILATSLAACADRPPQIIAVPTNGADLDRPGQMAVTGTATLEVSPDCADLTMTISADGAKPGDATKSVEAKEHALVDALVQLGVAQSDLKLSYLTLNPVYEPNPEGWAQIKVHAYRAEITVTATTHDFSRVAPIMDAGAEAGASAMSSAFRRSDLADLKKKVREMALAAAKDKAEQTAHALGIKLGRILAVSEAPAGRVWDNAYFPQAAANVQARAENGGVALGGTTQALTLDISISFELAKTT
jgi:uncharacterized protein YggE